MSVVAGALVFGDEATLVKIEDVQIHDLSQFLCFSEAKDERMMSSNRLKIKLSPFTLNTKRKKSRNV